MLSTGQKECFFIIGMRICESRSNFTMDYFSGLSGYMSTLWYVRSRACSGPKSCGGELIRLCSRKHSHAGAMLQVAMQETARNLIFFPCDILSDGSIQTSNPNPLCLSIRLR